MGHWKMGLSTEDVAVAKRDASWFGGHHAFQARFGQKTKSGLVRRPLLE
jgi:hypothetical protein